MNTTDAHVYVSLISVIDYFLALIFQLDHITSISDVSQMHCFAICVHIQVIRQRVHATVLVKTVPMILYVIFALTILNKPCCTGI